jgi:hypothetical protein
MTDSGMHRAYARLLAGIQDHVELLIADHAEGQGLIEHLIACGVFKHADDADGSTARGAYEQWASGRRWSLLLLYLCASPAKYESLTCVQILLFGYGAPAKTTPWANNRVVVGLRSRRRTNGHKSRLGTSGVQPFRFGTGQFLSNFRWEFNQTPSGPYRASGV